MNRGSLLVYLMIEAGTAHPVTKEAYAPVMKWFEKWLKVAE